VALDVGSGSEEGDAGSSLGCVVGAGGPEGTVVGGAADVEATGPVATARLMPSRTRKAAPAPSNRSDQSTPPLNLAQPPKAHLRTRDEGHALCPHPHEGPVASRSMEASRRRSRGSDTTGTTPYRADSLEGVRPMIEFGSVFASLLSRSTPDEPTWRDREYRDHEPRISRNIG